MRYDFVCMECDLEVELQRSIKDDTPVLCRVCGHVMQKVFTPPPIHFKGTGFNAERA